MQIRPVFPGPVTCLIAPVFWVTITLYCQCRTVTPFHSFKSKSYDFRHAPLTLITGEDWVHTLIIICRYLTGLLLLLTNVPQSSQLQLSETCYGKYYSSSGLQLAASKLLCIHSLHTRNYLNSGKQQRTFPFPDLSALLVLSIDHVHA